MSRDITRLPVDKVPVTTQAMWDVVSVEYERAEILAKAARDDKTSNPQIIARREREARLWKGICNAIDFIISNKDDIDRVIAQRQRKNAA
jgi:hypothetical protein